MCRMDAVARTTFPKKAHKPALTVTKDRLPEADQKFLNDLDDGGPEWMTEGKWSKLYAIIANYGKKMQSNYRIYQSRCGFSFDTSVHTAFLTMNDDTGNAQIGAIIKVKNHAKK